MENPADLAVNVKAKPTELVTPKINKNWFKKPWFKISVAIILLASVVTYFSRNIIFGTIIDVQYASTGNLTQTVVASGRILTPQRISIAAETTGRVMAIAVIEGQTVTRGQLLIQLNDADERANVANANAALLQVNAKLRQLREVVLPSANQSLSQANSNVEQLRKQLNRTAELTQKGFITQAQLDTAKRDFDVATS